ncbi:hypothetical protein [Gulosibacter sp. 10]|uniref:DUF6993 domain-containing protein n=1 Tax=Gulosibacter sp. 10 TaxID=1255570 RepID=UPI00097EFCF7|nr:hypothetical protein [Gulosibacter sp. 10]SJM51342.1 hypothetical protein FM112_01910 [Gulosibacter sp. 10]
MPSSRTLAAVASLLVGGLALAGCASDAPEPGPTDTAAATDAPAPTFVEGGGAEENKAYFDATLEQLLEANPEAKSHEMVNALVDAGFDKGRMEVTFDRTTVDLDADFVIVSVKMPDEQCLIGQTGTHGYASDVVAPMSTGNCLVGKTQEIDW